MNAVYDVPTLAERWACSIGTIRSLVASGELPSFKLGGKLVRIRADDVEKYECRNIASNDTAGSSPSSGTKTDDADAIRSERRIAQRPKQRRAGSGLVGR